MRRGAKLGCAAAVLVLVAAVGCGCGGGLSVVVGVPAAIRGQAALRERVERHEAAPDGTFVQAGDLELHLTTAGPEDGPPVVFVHGSGAWSGTWQPTLEAVAARGYRGIAVDLPPFGYSERPADGAYTTEAQAARLVALLEALDLHDVALVGHSFGGLATVEAAIRAPDRVRRLVLVDVAIGLDAGSEPLPWAASAALSARPVRDTLVAATFTDPWFVPYGLRSFVHDPAVVTPEVIARYVRPLDVSGTTAAISAWVPELVAPSTRPAAADAGRWATLDLPTTLIWGRRDTATPLAQAERLASLLPDGRLVVLEDVGHLPQVEDPTAFQLALIWGVAR